MTKAVTILLLLALAAASAAAQTTAVVQRASGRVEVQVAGGPWRPVAAGMRLDPGATISTGFDSEAALALGNSVVQVRPLTRMRIDQLAQSGQTVSTELYLRVGRVHADVRSAEGLKQDFKVKSPISTAAVRGTSFGFDGINTNVTSGLVGITDSSGQSANVGSGEQGSATGDSPPTGGQQNMEQQSTTQTSTGPLPSSTPPEFAPPPPPPGGPTTGSITINWNNPIL